MGIWLTTMYQLNPGTLYCFCWKVCYDDIQKVGDHASYLVCREALKNCIKIGVFGDTNLHLVVWLHSKELVA